MPIEHEQAGGGDESTFRVPDCIPIFPLPDLVFFPRTYLPLHIFEPRYREMVVDASREGRCIGMVLLREGWEEEYHGNPPIYELGCAGRVVSVQELAGGRYNLILQGLERYDILEQFYDRSYRRARIALRATVGEKGLEPALRAELLRLAGTTLGERADAPGWRELLRGEMPDEVLVNGLASSLHLTPHDKQFLLEADSLRQRTRRLIDLIHLISHEPNGVKGWA